MMIRHYRRPHEILDLNIIVVWNVLISVTSSMFPITINWCCGQRFAS